MIRINVDNLHSVSSSFYNRVCLDGKRGSPGLIRRIKEKLLLEPNLKRVKFYYQLMQDVKNDKGKSIILSDPYYLESRRDFYELNYFDILTDKFKKELENDVFFYDSYERWGAYELANKLKVDTCPYCNRQFTFTLETGDGKTRPQFDHFLNKANYPYFSLSFYNLVPSCYICNSSLKGKDLFSVKTHIHPYLEDYSEIFSFSIRPFKIDFINGVSSSYHVVFKFKDLKKNIEKILRIAGNLRTLKFTSYITCIKIMLMNL